MPQFTGSEFVVSPPQAPLPCPASEPQRSQKRMVQFHVSMATANVNSLHCGPEGYSGKPQLIRDQMKEFGLNILGIQESRSMAVCSTTDGVLRLGGGSEKGHFGVELWINLQQPFAQIGKRPIFLQKQQVTVVHKDPRILLTRIAHLHFDAWILVAHAPQSGQAERERERWWATVHEILQRFVQDKDLYVLIDANAAAGPTDACVVGPGGMGSSKSTKFFRMMLETWSLALPCTFSCHHGTRDTWTSPDGNTRSCIDYVCIPQGKLSSCVLSQVVTEFELGNCDIDHQVVAAQLMWKDMHVITKHIKKESKYCRDQIRPSTIANHLHTFEIPAWETDVHTQVTQHNAHVHDSLQGLRLQGLPTAKKSFITETIWQTRVSKLQCKRTVQEIGKRMKHEVMKAVFLAWKTRDEAWQQEHAVVFHRYAAALWCWKLHHCVLLHRQGLQLKRSLKKARCQALAADLNNLEPTTQATDILRVVKRHTGPTNLKTLKKPTLPMLQSSEGGLCIHPDQLTDAWVGFFASMEGGQRVSKEQLHELWRQHTIQFMQPAIQLGPEDVPCLSDLEQAFRRVKSGKALGQDGIPPEICKACPTILAKHYYSLLLKLLTHGQESLHHKGGTLVPAYKGKGSSILPMSYRSLLISSHMGKVLHRTVRQHQSQFYEKYLCQQQLGGRRKVPVNLGLHEARAFLRCGQTRGLSVGLVMLDLTEAFYRVLRPLAVGCPWDDAQIAAIAQKLKLPETALHDLYRHLDEPSALEQAHLPAHLRHAIIALHTDTFFQVPGQNDYCHTTIGSRPGDSFADVVFSYLFSRVLKSFQDQVAEHGIQEEVGSEAHLDPYAQGDDKSLVRQYMGPVWMDDLCLGLTATTPQLLINKAGLTMALLLETLEGYGMTPNLSKGKTELLVSLRGAGVRRCKQQLFGPQSSGTLPIVCESGVKHVSVVGQYQHLGGLLHHAGDHRLEMRKRVATANAAFNAHRRTIFQNRDIPMKKRIELFHTLILSKLVYGSKSWVLHTVKAKEYLHASVMRLYRRMCGLKPEDHSTDQEVLAALQLPSPTELFRQMRMRYLGTLHSCAEVVT